MSQITVINQTDDAVRVGVFRTPPQPDLGLFAWKVIEPPQQGGQSVFNVPATYKAYGTYGDQANTYGQYTTNMIDFSDTTARFIASDVTSQDGGTDGISIKQSFYDLVPGEVNMQNTASQGFWGHITQDDDDLFEPQVLPPGGVLMEDIRDGYYLAVVGNKVKAGLKVVDEVIDLPATQAQPGQTVAVTGSKMAGYSIAVE